MTQNYVPTPNDPTAAGWADQGTSTIALAVGNGPDNTTTAFSINDTDGSNISSKIWPQTVSADTSTYTAWIWVKKVSSTPAFYPALGVTLGDKFAPARYYGVVIDTKNGAVLAISAWYAPSGSGIISWDANWWLVWVSGANATSETTAAIRIMPAASNVFDGSISAVYGGLTNFWTAGLSLGAVHPLLPVASFTRTPTSGSRPLSVAFTDTSTNATSWAWNFGDAGTSTSQNPSHSFTSAGTYTVTLTANGDYGGTNTDVFPSCVTVNLTPPVVSFTYTPVRGAKPLAVTFTDTSTHTPTSWAWTFGDGSTSTSQSPSHTYTAAGLYDVALTATNVDGPDTKTVTAAVDALPSVAPVDPRLLGARSVASADAASFAVACTDSRRLVQCASSSGAWSITGDSGDIGSEPGKLILFSSKLWTITADGYLRRFTNASTPVNDLSVNIHADTNAWVTSSGSYLIAPIRAGGLASYNSSGVEQSRIEGVLPRIAFAIAYIPAASAYAYVYCFDGVGGGAIVAMKTSTGALSASEAFTATNCQGVLDGFVSGTSLVIAVAQLGAVIVFDLTAATAPVVSTDTAYGGTLYGVLNDASNTPLTAEVRDSLGLAQWFAATAGIALSASINAIANGQSARLQVT